MMMHDYDEMRSEPQSYGGERNRARGLRRSRAYNDLTGLMSVSRYDVFLSFRGEDTRASFTSHLYSSLSNAGILVFKDDDELPRGSTISIELSQGIEGSRISIIIFSRNYAGSRWCLDELSKIMESRRTLGQVVLPVFFGVYPSEVRRQTSRFGEAFQNLVDRTSANEEEVLRWKTLLHEAASIAGFVVVDSRNESEDINNIVEHVSNMLDRTDLFVTDHPVGVNSRVQDVIKMLDNNMSDVLMVGIWGMGGIGKTTIAKSIYNEIGRNFEGRSFLPNIREVWEQHNGQVCLQEHLLSEIYKTTKIKIHCIELGKIIMKERLRHKRVLIVLDDVNNLDQLNALSGSREWFGPGSRIIITTRDEHLLNVLKVDDVYRMKKMGRKESIELFSWHAFQQEHPREDFIELSRNVVAYSGGLPLALEVLGSYLLDRKVAEWKSVLEKLKRIPNDQIQKKLKISFDGLSDDIEKEIFLDIACFFIGMDRNDVTQILNGCGFFAEIGISVLVERSLVTVDKKNKLGMHDLLRDMGREIIREKSPKELGDRSRLWFHEDVLDVLSKYTVTTTKRRKYLGKKVIEGLALELPQINTFCLSTEAFRKMKRLRLLCLSSVQLAGDYRFISKNLRWLCWHGFPLKYIPSNFYQGNLVAIDLKYSNLKLVWKEPQLLERLKILNLSHSPYLTHTPDFSKLPNLEKLILENCPSLSVVQDTIGVLSKLLLMNLKDCTSLPNLPRSIYKLKSLRTLNLSGCSMIEKLEEDLEQMDSLTTLIADNTAITQVPFSIVRSKSIGYISLCGYEGLSCDVFPSLIWSWMSPTKNPVSPVPPYPAMLSSISFDVPNSTFLGLSSIHSDLPKLRSLRVDCRSVIQVNQDVSKILNSLYVTNIRSSMLANHHNQVHISGSENSLRHLLIQIGRNNQVTSTLSESILQGLTPRTCILPGDKYPYWLTYKGEGASVNFTVPRVNGCNLKGMTLCCVYSPSCVLVNMESDSLISVLIINYTKTTIQLYKGDTMTSLEDEEWLSIISNQGYDDHVEVIVVFGYGFSVKKTVAYLIYNESFDEKVEPSPTTNKNFLVYSGSDDIYRNSTRLRSKECRCYDEEEELYFIRPRKSLKM